MPNRDKRLRGLIVEWISGVLTNFISVNSLLRYKNPNNFTDPRDIPDLGEVMYQIGLAGGLTKKIINKLGSDVDGSGNLDLSLETGIPANANYTVYINGYAGLQAISYDENGMIMGGFGVAPTDTIKIIFI